MIIGSVRRRQPGATRPGRRALGCALLVAPLGGASLGGLTAACGAGAGGGLPSSFGPALAGIELSVSTAEWEAGARYLMLPGEVGRAWVAGRSADGTVVSPGPVSIGSSAANVVRVVPVGDGSVELQAIGVGSAVVSATAGGFSDARHVEVTPMPLPVDSMRVTLAPYSDSLRAEYDARRDMRWLEVPLGHAAALLVPVWRGDRRVFLALAATSAAPGVVRADVDCAPVEIVPRCEVHSDAWVTGSAPGDARVTVAVRNLSVTFTAHVPADR